MEEKKIEVDREYPKSLYQGGDRNGAHSIVNNANEERAARTAGFKMIDPDADQASVEALGDEADAPEPVVEKPAKKSKKA